MHGRVDLPAAAARRNKSGKSVTLRAIGPTLAAELEMRRAIGNIVGAGARLVRDHGMPIVRSLVEQLATDRSPEDPLVIRDDPISLGYFLQLFREFMIQQGNDVTPQILAILTREEARHRSSFQTAVRAATGIDIEPVLAASDVRPLIQTATQQSASLIRGLTDEMVKRVATVITREAMKGSRSTAIAKLLAKEFGWSMKRAKLIARDQTASFNSNLNRVRQQQAGVDKYEWSTSLDERVRGNPEGLYPRAKPSHWAREGRVFSWNKPPSDGHPGQPINCRCIARAVIG